MVSKTNDEIYVSLSGGKLLSNKSFVVENIESEVAT